MGKERGEVRTYGSGEPRRELQSRRPPRDVGSPPLEADFERAFADALRDILLHENRPAAA
jgi:hypothetical protein